MLNSNLCYVFYYFFLDVVKTLIKTPCLKKIYCVISKALLKHRKLKDNVWVCFDELKKKIVGTG